MTLKITGSGWCTLELNGIKLTGSYLTDIPMEWLESIKFSIEHRVPYSLYIDHEGSTAIITSYMEGTYIIDEILNEDDYTSTKVYKYIEDINYVKLASEICKSIEYDIDNWVLWTYESEYYTEKDKKYRKSKLLYLIDSIRRIISTMTIIKIDLLGNKTVVN